MGWSWRWSVRAVFLASLLVLASAQQPPPPRPPRGRGARPEMSATDVDAIVSRMCGASRPAGVPPLPLCQELRRSVGAGRQRQRHHRRPAPLMMPPPGRDEEVDLRYGVAKRLVPTGPNPLHN